MGFGENDAQMPGVHDGISTSIKRSNGVILFEPLFNKVTDHNKWIGSARLRSVCCKSLPIDLFLNTRLWQPASFSLDKAHLLTCDSAVMYTLWCSHAVSSNLLLIVIVVPFYQVMTMLLSGLSSCGVFDVNTRENKGKIECDHVGFLYRGDSCLIKGLGLV